MINDKQKVGDLLYRDKGLVTHVGVYLGGSWVAHIQTGRKAIDAIVGCPVMPNGKNGKRTKGT